jgi:hypothetical protein
MAIKIIVDTQAEKDDLIKQSAYIHGLAEVDIAETNTLAHLHVATDCIEVKYNHLSRKKQQYITPVKGEN